MYTVSDMLGNKDNMKSPSGYLMELVSWQSMLQKCVVLSTTEAEYMAATEAQRTIVAETIHARARLYATVLRDSL